MKKLYFSNARSARPPACRAFDVHRGITLFLMSLLAYVLAGVVFCTGFAAFQAFEECAAVQRSFACTVNVLTDASLASSTLLVYFQMLGAACGLSSGFLFMLFFAEADRLNVKTLASITLSGLFSGLFNGLGAGFMARRARS